MNSAAPFLPPIPELDCFNFAGNDLGGWTDFLNPGGFPLLMPPPPLPNDDSFFFSGDTSSETKAQAASKTHREAERLRRKRINDHLDTLRSLLPNLLKSDKASLLTEAVRRLRELKEETSQLTVPSVSDEKLLPEDIDSLRVRRCEVNGGILVATLSCEERPELLHDITRALKTVKAKIVEAEMATVGGRMKMVLKMHDAGGREGMAALTRALRVVIDRPTCSGYGSTFGLFGPKRQRR